VFEFNVEVDDDADRRASLSRSEPNLLLRGAARAPTESLAISKASPRSQISGALLISLCSFGGGVHLFPTNSDRLFDAGASVPRPTGRSAFNISGTGGQHRASLYSLRIVNDAQRRAASADQVLPRSAKPCGAAMTRLLRKPMPVEIVTGLRPWLLMAVVKLLVWFQRYLGNYLGAPVRSRRMRGWLSSALPKLL